MKVLLTGYKGFIGSHLYRALKNKGHDVTTFEWGELLPSVIAQDWVIHTGAISSTTERDIEKIMRQNVDCTIDLYDSCKKFGVKFQFSSSASVYGMNTEFKEDSQADPKTPYAWSKYLCERYIMNNMSQTTQIFRYFNVYGPEGEEHKGNQASPFCQFKKQSEKFGKITVFENSEKYCRDFIHVDDVVQYHLRFLDIDCSGIFNVGSGKTQSFMDVAKTFNVPIHTIPMPENLIQSYQKYTCADMTKTCGISSVVERDVANV
jgi:ADP-L-glycero-D-manno-heptose 6-epimerase